MHEGNQIRIHGDASLPTLVYLPGVHGDWTLVSSFRAAVADKVRFVEFTYARTTVDSLADYAREIERLLLARGIARGWLLGESFGSQPAWELVRRYLESPRFPSNVSAARDPATAGGGAAVPAASAAVRSATDSGAGGPDGTWDARPTAGQFRPLGLILAGGFVRHPTIWAVRRAQRFSAQVPMRVVKLFCVVYARYAKFRHKRAPETLASIDEFVANRTTEMDRRAIVHRYKLIAENDLRPVARRTLLPVYYLAGLVDPLVPWPFVRWWLRNHCPGYRGGKTIWRADHNVLGTQPKVSADLILQWMSAVPAATADPFRKVHFPR